MIKFLDYYGNPVILSFERNAFDIKPDHVFVICRYKQAWLLTKHPIRGLEFPGGKVEKGENLEEAAKREVFEETGGIVQNLQRVGEYYVEIDSGKSFVKAIFFANIQSIIQKKEYHETNGPHFIYGDIRLKLKEKQFSFIMKDEVVPRVLYYICKGVVDVEWADC